LKFVILPGIITISGRAFVGFLTSGKARRVFEKHGFIAGR
jgi:ABC-type molybdate transport system substrate-binding protein